MAVKNAPYTILIIMLILTHQV